MKRISKWGGGLLKLGVTFAFHQVHQTIHLYVFHNSRFLHSKFKINIIRERNRFNTGWSLSMIVQVDHQRPHCKLAVSLEQLVQHLDIDFKHVWIFSHEIFPSMEYGQFVEYFHKRYSLLWSMDILLNIFTRDIPSLHFPLIWGHWTRLSDEFSKNSC